MKGKCAFIEFDSGDGTGVRLHRVLASTLIGRDDPRAPKPKATAKKATAPKVEPKAKAATPKAEALPKEIAQAFEAMKALKAMIEANGYEVTME
ncbi:MAG: hypothetical protein J6S85_19465 [Methanobrevibacter sp.]|nr:hypothetical protein [Methanobrevibacter sp.]